MKQHQDKLLLFSGLTIYIILLALTVRYHQERVIYSDMSFHTYALVTEGRLAIMNFRFIALFSQLLPLALIHIGASLKSIVIAYSASFYLISLLLYLIAVYKLKQTKWALILPLSSIIMTSSSFFWPQSELQAVIIWWLFAIIIANYHKDNPHHLGWHTTYIIIQVFIAFGHPVMVFPILAYYLIKYLSKDQRPSSLETNGLLVYLLFYIIKSTCFKNSYESQAFDAVSRVASLWTEHKDVALNFMVSYLTEYIMMTILGIMVVYNMIVRKNYLAIVIFVVFSIAYTLLIVGSFGAYATTHYTENQLLPLGAIVLALSIGGRFFDNNKWLIISAVSMLLFVWRVNDHATYYKERLEAVKTIVAQHSHHKIVLQDDKALRDRIESTWTLSYESWLIGQLSFGATPSILAKDDPKAHIEQNNGNKVFLPFWGEYRYEDLPQEYFTFKDTMSVYTTE